MDGWPTEVGEYMWKQGWSRTSPPRGRGLESEPSLAITPSVSLDARKGAYPSGYRREPSADRGVSVVVFLPCQAGCLPVTGGALGSLRAWPPPQERG